jgi:hypothetical protein
VTLQRLDVSLRIAAVKRRPLAVAPQCQPLVQPVVPLPAAERQLEEPRARRERRPLVTLADPALRQKTPAVKAAMRAARAVNIASSSKSRASARPVPRNRCASTTRPALEQARATPAKCYVVARLRCAKKVKCRASPARATGRAYPSIAASVRRRPIARIPTSTRVTCPPATAGLTSEALQVARTRTGAATETTRQRHYPAPGARELVRSSGRVECDRS